MTPTSRFTIALAGNPNVGKSTIFNALTGLRQHTGNWSGKTVACASGLLKSGSSSCLVVDLPGTYSLQTHSEEEAIARNYLLSGQTDLLLTVCDATCLERGLRLLKQIQTLGQSCPKRQILCVNLCDEAAKKGISIHFKMLEETLGIPVVPCSARSRNGLTALRQAIQAVWTEWETEYAAESRESSCTNCGSCPCPCCACGCTGCGDTNRNRRDHGDTDRGSADSGNADSDDTYSNDTYSDDTNSSNTDYGNVDCGSPVSASSPLTTLLHSFSPASLASQAVVYKNPAYLKRQLQIDRLVTGPWTGGLLMLLLLMGIFWITINGANYPSAFLWDVLFGLEGRLAAGLAAVHAPDWFISCAVYGVYRVVAWVVSVMLPPMAIFFPLFTLLEDLGYLPRAAFNMDCAFKKCRACGKQCLTMAMGFGCNAAGVVGCRIIDSPRERLIAILTNAMVPCNGRFPTLILLITLSFMGIGTGFSGKAVPSLATAAALTSLILLGVLATLLSSWALSRTILKGLPSSFTLELPPYRRPQFGKVILHSILDRTLFVLARAVAVAAPAGLLIWLLGNINFDGGLKFAAHALEESAGSALAGTAGNALAGTTGNALAGTTGNVLAGAAGSALTGAAGSALTGTQGNAPSLLLLLSSLLDPLGRLLGLDGMILLAFLLGFPANEIVLPIILMGYLQTGCLVEMSDPSALSAIFTAHGWTMKTVICMAIFSLFHWPCSTTCLTIRKETGSWKWTAAAILLPTFIGAALCCFIQIAL